MKSLSQFLGSKKFFFGDQMTLLDIIVHGFTTQVYYMSPDCSKIKQGYETLQNMRQHCNTVKEIVYPDWEDLLYKAK
jgi:glutathione S-transferase